MTDEPTFAATSTLDSDVLLVTAEGEVDMSTSPRLLDAVNAVSEVVRLVIIDLTQVTFLDSSGLNTLVRAQRQLAPRGIALRIVSPSDRVVRRVFEIAHLEDELTLVETVADARA
jgi:stage II sporulation protein AA (anti-sigma F factor antagonist)